VVTLDGKIIDVSGTMSGGGANPSRGGMTRSVDSHAQDPEALKETVVQNNRIADVCIW
jgi:structural maintenance of chromosome 4